MVTRVRHVGIVVSDIDAAQSFWCEVLGFALVRRMEESGPYLETLTGLKDARATTVKLAAPDGNLVELLKFESHPDKPAWSGTPCSTGLTHLAMTVDDLDLEHQRLSAHGVRFVSPPLLSPDGKVKVAYCVGIEGLLLELVQEIK